MTAGTLEIIAASLFGVAVLHTFLVKRFEVIAHRYPPNSVTANIFELLGEVEVVFGIWAGVFLVIMGTLTDPAQALAYLEGRAPGFHIDFTEPAFVFAIMAMASTRPVIATATRLIRFVARAVPLPGAVAFFITTLFIGPILGSLITGPAAMTVTALILKRHFYDSGLSDRLKYATLGVLFVNISIGGTLTNFAAPPVLMVADVWNWDSLFMLTHFGWKAIIAVGINAAGITFIFRDELTQVAERQAASPIADDPRALPIWLVVIHLLAMAAVVILSHHIAAFLLIFLLFLGVVDVTQEFQDRVRLRESLLVACFLAGLVLLGTYQRWWLQPLLLELDAFALFSGSAALTAITDNAALTYLGSLVTDLAEGDKYALVAGAVAGGGLTVIANAPNPAGHGILKHSFGADGISPLGLLLAAALPTLVAAAALLFLPHIQ